MHAARSAASRISRPRRSTTSALSTRPIIAPTMRCWWSPGNFDPAQLDALGRPVFRARSRSPTARSRASPSPSRRAPRPTRHTVYEPNTPLPAVLISCHAPRRPRSRHPGAHGAQRASCRPARARGSIEASSIATSSRAGRRHVPRHPPGHRQPCRVRDPRRRQDGAGGRGGAAPRGRAPARRAGHRRPNWPRRRTRS